MNHPTFPHKSSEARGKKGVIPDEDAHCLYAVHSKHHCYPFQPLLQVTCIFAWGGVTYPYHRKYSPSDPWSNKSWAQVKNGIGTSPSGIPDKENYFIGLDRLHELVSQAEYLNHIFSMYNGWSMFASAFYKNFTVGPESSDYELRYNTYYWLANPADDGLQVKVAPTVFSTFDHDPNGCAARKYAAGWYGSDKCLGFSMFADPMYWPVFEYRWQVNEMIFNLIRTSNFYEG